MKILCIYWYIHAIEINLWNQGMIFCRTSLNYVHVYRNRGQKYALPWSECSGWTKCWVYLIHIGDYWRQIFLWNHRFWNNHTKMIIKTTLLTTKSVTALVDGSISGYFSIFGSIILYTEPVFMTLILFSYICKIILSSKFMIFLANCGYD